MTEGSKMGAGGVTWYREEEGGGCKKSYRVVRVKKTSAGICRNAWIKRKRNANRG